MRIVVADQGIEDHAIEQTQNLGRTGTRDTANKIKALRQIRTTFVLVFHFGHHVQGLAKVLLVHKQPMRLRVQNFVIARHQHERTVQNPMHGRPGGSHLHGFGQRHAKNLVDHAVIYCMNWRLQHVRAWRAVAWQSNAVTVKNNRQLVLGTGQ